MGIVTSHVRERPGRSCSWRVLMAGGFALIGVGCYFLFLRPSLLPEDARYLGMPLDVILVAVPRLQAWLSKVFVVLGGYIVSVGMLTCYVARIGLRERAPGALAVACMSGTTSIGLMVTVNFLIHSDFRWVLLLLIVPWISAVFLYWREGTWTATQAS